MTETNRDEVPDLEKRAGAVLSREWRKARDLRQGKVAEMLHIRQSTLSDWEASLKEPSLSFAFRYEALTEGAVPASSWALKWRRWRRLHPGASGEPAPKKTGTG